MKSDVHIYLGRVDEDNKENFRLGRIHFHIIWGYVGLTHYKIEEDFNKWKNALIIAGGPIISLLMVLLFEWLTASIDQNKLSYLFLLAKNGCLGIFLISILPIPYFGKELGGLPSDGLQLLQLLKNKK